MANRQPHLNHKFYRPAVPPPTKTHPGRPILCTIATVAIGFIIGVGILLLIIGLVYRPTELEFVVTNAKLTQFNFTSNTNFQFGSPLHYKLALNVTITNPNKRYKVYYDTNEMAVLYNNQRLQTQWLPAFFQDTDTTVVALDTKRFEGEQLVFLDNDGFVEFNVEKSSGAYPIDVKFFFRLRMKSGQVVLKLKPKVYCGLMVPLNDGTPPRPGVMLFDRATICDFKF